MLKKLRFIIIAGAILAALFNFESALKSNMIGYTNNILSSYLNSVNNIKSSFNSHFDQKKQIEELKSKVEALQGADTLLQVYKTKLANILSFNYDTHIEQKAKIVEAIAYEKISDYNKVWIKMDDFNASKIYGLVKNNSTAGIIVTKNNKPLALLQGDKQCIFAISIGPEAYPGVATGAGEFIHAKYIPLWMKPKIGDEVVTSGLDGIFHQGINVGKVVEVQQGESYQTAIIEPSTKARTPDFFYILR